MLDILKLNLVKLFLTLTYFLWSKFGIRFRGYGKIQDIIKNEHIITFFGKNLFFAPGIKNSYDYLLVGKSNEPETHLFFSLVIPEINEKISFIDVGASVGEMMLGVSIFNNVDKIIGFEPRKECVYAIEKTIKLNDEDRMSIFNVALSDQSGSLTFYQSGTDSGMLNNNLEKSHSFLVEASTMDKMLNSTIKNPIILIDVEGAEPKVLKGGAEFILKNMPLIIFEFNNTSKKHFTLIDIQEILGNNYQIYRLRDDGNLDKDFSYSWNCVAVNDLSVFKPVINRLIIQ